MKSPSALINKIHLVKTFPPPMKFRIENSPLFFRREYITIPKETMGDMNFVENNREIQYSKEPDLKIPNNHQEEVELLENLYYKRLKKSMQLSLYVRNWAKFIGFKLNQRRAEYFTKKNMRYNMVWRYQNAHLL